jgi:hypothetical protein
VSAPPNNPVWKLERFVEELDLWLAREEHSADHEAPVLVWIQSRMDDPYLHVSREGWIDNLWYGRIPGTVGPDGRVAVGSYFIFEAEKLVKCNSFALLSPPI